MRQYDLVERVRSYNPDTNEDLLNRAYVYAMKAHGTQTRASGDPYFSHPLEVAAILTNLKLDDATIVAALLHDTIEDTEATRAEIDNVFGHEIGALVEGLTKLKRLELVSREAKQAENLRKLLLAIADDVRVLLIKLADRLHNMRTLEFVPRRPRAGASPRRRWISMRRWPAAWVCTRCARSSRTCRSSCSIPRPMRWSSSGSIRWPSATAI
ncbi:(p)ppGpp synthase/HD superfamily hydrolase [Bradyrhizobium elkanii]